ncbi:hypothetical protein BO83DRAFT_374214 [Aspergillus eucalypticola CBS 122712]|uniref:Uncharacterized protein n=1 Tax=Aspergillus eucalypticola (strain CBS 122712 / IBT 29274) TaxID=1448314 RepID=A0A317WG56_ASPEC|nr:uncharacterized protein BO83DRAFT_374214 [Aspergillus eucalypticola CBS 122712]PWY85456.1 hypothetical protein BO83DRAFT_374214 [Aspergillus eucalypticola CBS 122712]
MRCATGYFVFVSAQCLNKIYSSSLQSPPIQKARAIRRPLCYDILPASRCMINHYLQNFSQGHPIRCTVYTPYQ